jgi:hypothetical protein
MSMLFHGAILASAWPSARSTLIKDIERNCNDGIGKPEPLEHGFQGYWSRRITDEHRLVSKITKERDTRSMPLPPRPVTTTSGMSERARGTARPKT